MPRERRERLVAIAGLALCAATALAIAARLGDAQPIDAVLAALPAGAPAAHRPTTGMGEPGPAPRAFLSVTVWPSGPGHRSRTWRITCPPSGPACASALARSATLRAGEARTGCDAPAGGPGEAMVLGSVRGRPVDTWLDQRDACDAEAWSRLRLLLRPPRAAATRPRASS